MAFFLVGDMHWPISSWGRSLSSVHSDGVSRSTAESNVHRIFFSGIYFLIVYTKANYPYPAAPAARDVLKRPYTVGGRGVRPPPPPPRPPSSPSNVQG